MPLRGSGLLQLSTGIGHDQRLFIKGIANRRRGRRRGGRAADGRRERIGLGRLGAGLGFALAGGTMGTRGFVGPLAHRVQVGSQFLGCIAQVKHAELGLERLGPHGQGFGLVEFAFLHRGTSLRDQILGLFAVGSFGPIRLSQRSAECHQVNCLVSGRHGRWSGLHDTEG